VIKTLGDWRTSGRYLGRFLSAGDLVDVSLVEHMRDSVPPVRNSSSLMQAGEAVTHVNGRATFTTFVHVRGETWRYVGCCHAGQTSEPKKDPP
jgi:hypothetical protein